jgi:imidazoleglycerol-phosphate dehydratase
MDGMESKLFTPVRVRRATSETDFVVRMSPRIASGALIDLPNRVLAHFLDHFSKASGIGIEFESASWPRSWEFDHVLCEDVGQLAGRAVAAIAVERITSGGVSGRAAASSPMDECATIVALTFESRPRCEWRVPRWVDINGYVDSWYGPDGAQAGTCFGTNLRQFFDGFAYGSGASVWIDVRAGGNLHHLYETVFRNLGDAVGAALGTATRLAGESSGLAGAPRYDVTRDAHA